MCYYNNTVVGFVLLLLICIGMSSCRNYNQLRFHKVKRVETVEQKEAEDRLIEPIRLTHLDFETDEKYDLATSSIEFNPIIQAQKNYEKVIVKFDQWTRNSSFHSTDKRYPGQQVRGGRSIAKLVWGIILVTLGSLLLLAALIGNVGAYGLDYIFLIWMIVFVLIITTGILLLATSK